MKEKFEVSFIIYNYFKMEEEEEEVEEVELDDEILAGMLDDDVKGDYIDKQKKLQEKKDLRPVDHTQILYTKFKKVFYREC